MALSEVDRQILQRCLAHEPRSWENFVDRFLGLILHVVDHATRSRGVSLGPSDREDMVGEVLLQVVHDDYVVLRNFRGQSSLAAYMAVVARRVVVRELAKRRPARSAAPLQVEAADSHPAADELLGSRDEVERLMSELEDREAAVVRLFHLEGKSYQEISEAVGMPENTVGPTLSRAREKMRKVGNS